MHFACRMNRVLPLFGSQCSLDLQFSFCTVGGVGHSCQHFSLPDGLSVHVTSPLRLRLFPFGLWFSLEDPLRRSGKVNDAQWLNRLFPKSTTNLQPVN